MGDFPYISVRVSEGARGSSPLRNRRRSNDGRTREFGFFESDSDIFGPTYVVRQFDSGSTMAAECGPQSKYHGAGLEETHFIVRLLRSLPADCLVKSPSSTEVADSECYQTDSLIHADIMTSCQIFRSTYAGCSFWGTGLLFTIPGQINRPLKHRECCVLIEGLKVHYVTLPCRTL